MPRLKRFFVSIGIALLIAAAVVGVVRGSGPIIKDGWNLSCIQLNDLIEEYWLERPENVGIYVETFGHGAEAACQIDHRADAQTLFYWVFTPVERIHLDDPRYNPAASIYDGESVEISGHSSIRSEVFSLPAGRYLATTTWRESGAAEKGYWVGVELVGISDSKYVQDIGLSNSPEVSGTATEQFEVRDPETRFFIIASDYLLGHWSVTFTKLP